MLTALNERQQLVQLTMWSQKDELKKLRERHRFYCPACKGQLVLKIGAIMIPHFAHLSDNTCLAFSEGEGNLHIQGKTMLYHWFKEQSIAVSLEPYLAVIQQRPDLLLKIQDDYIAIEFQCSAISSELFLKRTAGYQSLGIPTLWIPLEKKAFFRGLQKMRISPFYALFIQKNKLFTLDVATKQLHKSQLILHIAGQQYITYNDASSLRTMSFPFTMEPDEVDIELLAATWFKERERAIKNRLRFNKKGLKDVFLKYCYEQRIAILDLPNWIGLPNKYRGKSHSVEWQLLVALLLKQYEEESVAAIFQRLFPSYAVPKKVIADYIRFIKRVNPRLLWHDVKNSSITEEISANLLH